MALVRAVVGTDIVVLACMVPASKFPVGTVAQALANMTVEATYG
jgi:hypothetical protein